jgi:hypothetical protein
VVTMEIEGSVSTGDSISAVEGVVTISDDRCMRTAPLAGALTRDVLDVSAAAAGRVSKLTFVEIDGVVSGSRIDGTVSMSGDGQLPACDLDRSAIELVR